jgi:hypothetical protein
MEVTMSKRKEVPEPKPDHIRSLRDLAANFVRAIDRTALEYEGTATAELTERVACLVKLDQVQTTDPELAKTPTADLRQRVSLLRQVAQASADSDWETRQMTNGELKKRIEHIRNHDEAARQSVAVEAQVTAAIQKTADELGPLDLETLETLLDRVKYAVKVCKKAQAKVAKAAPSLRVVADDDDEETNEDVIGDEEEAA